MMDRRTFGTAIVCGGIATLTRAAKAATATIPIVMTVGGDPVAGGLVQSLARPGGNVTGLTFQVGPEIDAKRLELLREMLPRVSRIAFLANKEENNWEAPAGQRVRAAAQALGLVLVPVEASRHEYTDALAQITRARVEALFVARSSHAYVNRTQIVEFATRNRLPSSYDNRDFIGPGGLMSYGANPTHNFARAASYVDKILKGSAPGELPIEQPTKYELLINLKTAKALGLTVPQSILLRADEVFQ
jgi:putative ABC transport system substrate-binding protein